MIIEKRERNCKIKDVAALNDSRMNAKEQEKIEKYQELRWEVARLWKMKKVEVIPVVVGALGTITNKLCREIDNNDKVRDHIDKQLDIAPTGRICGQADETIAHVVAQCSPLAQNEYKKVRHDNIAAMMPRDLCQKYGFPFAEKKL